MKLQCSCGAKYTFEVTPEMAREPVHFVCSACGMDASAFVTQLVRQELGLGAPPAAAIAPPPPNYAPPAAAIAPPPPGYAAPPANIAIGSARTAPPPVPVMAPPPPALAPPPPGVTLRAATASIVSALGNVPPAALAAPAVKPTVRINKPVPTPGPVSVASPVAGGGNSLRIHKEEPAPHAPEHTTEESDASKPCFRHAGEFAVDTCYICQKPICPKCMELFGYVCSPLCKAKADSHGIDVPVFAGQKSVVDARVWRRTVLIASTASALLALVLGGWFWYEWWGCTPRQVFSVRFAEPHNSGQSAFAGKDQIVFLHGGTLARYGLKDKREVWAHYLVDTNQLDREMAQELKDMQVAITKAESDNPEFAPKMPDPQKMRRNMIKGAEGSLHLRVIGQNIWVMSPGKLTQYDWDTGKPRKDLSLQSRFGNLIRRGDELLLLDDSGESLTRVNLNTCESRTEDIGLPKTELARADKMPANPGLRGKAGLPMVPGQDLGKPLDPARVAEQAQRLPLAARIALPATLANSANQERTLRELNDDPGGRPQPGVARKIPSEMFSLIPTKDGFVQFATRMIEEHIVRRSAMKPATGKSVLNENLNVTQTMDVANEILNDMQRSRGGDTVEEDESRYLVKLRSPNGQNEWTGEVVGPPRLYPCRSVNVVAANKTILVFDQANKKLWQATLSHNVSGAAHDFDDEEAAGTGEGPCVERNGVLYVFDQGVLTAFELASGNARWRLPSVGISGLFFDNEGMLYINTTDAGPDALKFSRQIDVSQKVGVLVQKIDPKNGKVLWTEMPGGPINYVIGKYIYTVASFDPGDSEDESPYTPDTGFETKPYVKIKLINPKNGHVVWEHFQQRAPLDIEFEKNTIRMVFRKEVQVLKFVRF